MAASSIRLWVQRAAGLTKSKAWAHLRALFILFHVVAVAAVACPAPTKGTPSKIWQRESVQAEVRGWAERLQRLGVAVTPAELTTFGHEASVTWTRIRTPLVAPFVTYNRYSGVGQGWYMFTAPDRYPAAFELEVRRGGRYSTLFLLGRADNEWRTSMLLDHRLRRAFFQVAWADGGARFRSFCESLATRAFVDFADADLVRCRLWQTPVQTVDELRRGVARQKKQLRAHEVPRKTSGTAILAPGAAAAREGSR